jgi:molybdopterin synthase sulfur carrier subunit
MRIQVLFFAGLRERVGSAGQELSLPDGATVADAWSRSAGDNVLSDNVLAARNMEYVAFNSELSDGDEVAFFPPVTGGAG